MQFKLFKLYVYINNVNIFQPDNHESELKAESDPAVSFEGLHNTLNRFRSRH
jgi:hypothetical protein